MTSPESRVLSAPIRSTLIGPIVAGAVWILLAVFWFSRTSWDTATTSIGGFSASPPSTSSPSASISTSTPPASTPAGAASTNATTSKWLGLVGFIFAVLSPSLTGTTIAGPRAMNVVAIVALVLIGLCVIITVFTRTRARLARSPQSPLPPLLVRQPALRCVARLPRPPRRLGHPPLRPRLPGLPTAPPGPNSRHCLQPAHRLRGVLLDLRLLPAALRL
ncbi:MAG: hypothetical protein U1U88_001406 [Lawsonella clevelandensis]